MGKMRVTTVVFSLVMLEMSLCSVSKPNLADQLTFTGIFPVVVTPFTQSGEIDYTKFDFNIRKYQQTSNVSGYVIGGSNSEVAALTSEERVQLVKQIRSLVPADKIIIGGASAESTKEAIKLSRDLKEAGANAVLVLPPFYFKSKMTDKAILQHFNTLANESPVPVVIYNNPGVSGIDLSVNVIKELSKHNNIIGIKDVEVKKIASTVLATDSEKFKVFTASGGLLLPALQMGASGGITGLASVLLKELVDLNSYTSDKMWDLAVNMQKRLIPIDLFIGRLGVAGLKAAMELKGFQPGYVRAPLQEISEDDKAKLRELFQNQGFL